MPIGREMSILNHSYGRHLFEGNTPNWTKWCLVHIPIQVILGFASFLGITQLKQMASCSYFNSSHFKVCIFFWEVPKLKQIYMFIIFNLPVYGLHVFGGLTQLKITPNPLVFLLVVSLYCCCLGDFCKNTCSRQH